MRTFPQALKESLALYEFSEYALNELDKRNMTVKQELVLLVASLFVDWIKMDDTAEVIQFPTCKGGSDYDS